MENNAVNISQLQERNKSTCSGQTSQHASQPTPTNTATRINRNKLIDLQKAQMMSVDKQRLADTILKQNSVIMQQSNQMVDLVKLVNELDNSQDNTQKIDPVTDPVNGSELQRNINILKNRNDVCKEASELRQRNVRLFESSVRIQFVLFSLFILVLFWLVYHYMAEE